MRFSDNPLKSPLAGTEIIPATDPASLDDVGITPQILIDWGVANGDPATGTANGYMAATDKAKLDALPDNVDLETDLNAAVRQALGLVLGVPTNGYIPLFYNVLGESIQLKTIYVRLASGTLTLTVKINGVAIPDLTNIPVTSSGFTYTASGSSGLIVANGELGLEIAAVSSPVTFLFSGRSDIVRP